MSISSDNCTKYYSNSMGELHHEGRDITVSQLPSELQELYEDVFPYCNSGFYSYLAELDNSFGISNEFLIDDELIEAKGWDKGEIIYKFLPEASKLLVSLTEAYNAKVSICYDYETYFLKVFIPYPIVVHEFVNVNFLMEVIVNKVFV